MLKEQLIPVKENLLPLTQDDQIAFERCSAELSILLKHSDQKITMEKSLLETYISGLIKTCKRDGFDTCLRVLEVLENSSSSKVNKEADQEGE